MELYGFMEREKKIPSYFFIITKNLRTFAAVMKQGNTNQQLAMQRNIFVLAFFLIIYLAIPNKLLPPPYTYL